MPVALTGYAAADKANHPQLSFGVIADPQYADVNAAGTRHYRDSLGKLKTAAAELNKHDLKFLITLGDIIDRDLASFKDIVPLYNLMMAPRKFVLGNHDFEVADADKGKVLDCLGMKQSYHSETLGDWCFIYLDGTDVSTYRNPKGSAETASAMEVLEKMKQEKRNNARPWNGALGANQLKWFSAELDKANSANQRVIVFNHYPIFPIGDGHNLWNDKEVVELIEKHPNVVAYMNGHNHKGSYAVNKGCHYINFKGMVETKEMSAYAVVRCYADRIEVDGYETEPDRTCLSGGRR
ncbi:MAG: metallophosphoesterase [Verrucomicrobiae bacterium]|nr:metallophosphoesterase [Verrucomicrobiae bacterium]NNJ43606.1 phosphatase [Akkermansiaceae bacterium]